MPRPNVDTPVETTVSVLRAAADWAREYAQQLERVFGDDYDGATMARALAEQLESAEQTYERARREDTTLDDPVQTALADVREFIGEVLEQIREAFEDADNRDAMLNDFAPQPPDSVRSFEHAKRALAQLAAAVEHYEERMRQARIDVGELQHKLVLTFGALEEAAEKPATENEQTRAARRERDQLRQEAVDFVRNLQLAAEAVQLSQRDPLEDLHALFAKHGPPAPAPFGRTASLRRFSHE